MQNEKVDPFGHYFIGFHRNDFLKETHLVGFKRCAPCDPRVAYPRVRGAWFVGGSSLSSVIPNAVRNLLFRQCSSLPKAKADSSAVGLGMT